MLAAARKYDRVVQVGTQRRSTPHLIEAKEKIVEAGLLGKIAQVEMCCYYHMRANGNPDVKEVPEFFNYDLRSEERRVGKERICIRQHYTSQYKNYKTY